MPVELKVYKCGDEVALFEVGHRTPDNGCDYVLNPRTRQLEQIYAHIDEDVEGTWVSSVGTTPDIYYEVDGITVFAKKIGNVALVSD